MLIAEIFSPSTESYDRGKKFAHYRSINSLKQYVLVAQDEPHVETFLRQEGSLWLYSDCRDIEGQVELRAIECLLQMREICDRIQSEASGPAV